MIRNKKLFSKGLALLVSFLIVLVLIFMPIFNGQNALDTLDALFNSISKGSAYKNIRMLKTGISPFEGIDIEVPLDMPNEAQARQSALLFERSRVRVYREGSNSGSVSRARLRSARM